MRGELWREGVDSRRVVPNLVQRYIALQGENEKWAHE